MKSEDIQEFDVNDFVSNADGLRGGGSFGKVFLCKHKKLEYVVVKCFPLNLKSDDPENKNVVSK